MLVESNSHQQSSGISQIRVDLEYWVGVTGIVQTEEVCAKVPFYRVLCRNVRTVSCVDRNIARYHVLIARDRMSSC